MYFARKKALIERLTEREERRLIKKKIIKFFGLIPHEISNYVHYDINILNFFFGKDKYPKLLCLKKPKTYTSVPNIL